MVVLGVLPAAVELGAAVPAAVASRDEFATQELSLPLASLTVS